MVVLTLEEIAKHNSEKDCWIIIRGKVYEVTNYLDDHPGGVEIITDLAGQDTTEDFDDVGHSEDAEAQLKSFYIGDVNGNMISSKSASLEKMKEIPDSGSKNIEVKKTVEVAKTVEVKKSVVIAETPKVVVEAPKVVEKPRYDTPKSDYKPTNKREESEGTNMLLVGAGVAAVAAIGFLLLRKKK